MRSIKKSQKLEHVCYDIRGPVLEEAKRLEDEGYTIAKLTIGNPGRAANPILDPLDISLYNHQKS